MVFPIIQRMPKHITRQPLHVRMNRNGGRVQHRPNGALRTNMSQISRKPIAHVNHGDHLPSGRQCSGKLNARRKIHMPAKDAATQWPGHIDPIAHLRAASCHRRNPSRPSQNGDAQSQLPIPRSRVPSHNRTVKQIPSLTQPQIQFPRIIHPHPARQGDAQPTPPPAGTPSRRIRQIPIHHLPPDLPRRMNRRNQNAPHPAPDPPPPKAVHRPAIAAPPDHPRPPPPPATTTIAATAPSSKIQIRLPHPKSTSQAFVSASHSITICNN